MTKYILTVLSVASLAFGCSDNVSEFRSALTGDACEPDVATLHYEGDPAKKAHKYCKSNNGHGNNEDGVDSSNPGQGQGGPNGETDQSCDGTGECIDDENRGGANGGEGCELPPGCDEYLCCDPDYGDDDDGDDDDGDDDDGDDDDGDDDDGDDGEGYDGDPNSCEVTCDTIGDCSSERSCVEGCCVVDLQ